jgi:short-subunit dehydrogenase
MGAAKLKNIVITGSTRGLGFYMAREFLKYGCNVTVSSRSEKSLEVAKGTGCIFGTNTICSMQCKDKIRT